MEHTFDTKVWHVDKAVEKMQSCSHVVDAAKFVEQGEVVAFPTETVYGLGANALSEVAVAKIFQAKGRPSDNPLIIHIGDMSQLAMIAKDIPETAQKLIDAFWPGPLTLFLPKTEHVPDIVTAGLSTVGVRMPEHPLALALIKQAGVPIAAPSANRSGRPSPTTAEHVREDLGGRIVGILDGGPTGVGVESTTIDMTVHPPLIHRPGGITYEQIKDVIGDVEIDQTILTAKQSSQQSKQQPDPEMKPVSPGMKYTHYAPKGDMWLVSGAPNQARLKMSELLTEAKASGAKTGVLTTAEQADWWRKMPQADVVLICGTEQDISTVARDLYATLRVFDEQQVQFIVAPTFATSGVGLAVMNRLEKAAGGRILMV